MKILFLLSTITTFSVFAQVKGELVEKFGTQYNVSSFKEWAEKENALFTPESTNLATQHCFRTSQEQLDGIAYDRIALPLVSDMKKNFFERPTVKLTAVGGGLAKLANLLQTIKDLNVLHKSPDEYVTACSETTKKFLDSNPMIEVLYEGRFKPEQAPNISKDLKAKLDKLTKNGAKVVPLNKDGLIEQICKLEGYYSTSYDQRLWKFFSITRAMLNVLPTHKNNAEFESLTLPVASNIRKLDQYSSVAGKSNGLSIGMNEKERKYTQAVMPVRLTGVALGSNASAMMSFFTTAWREKLQDAIISQDYPNKPFELLDAKLILNAVNKTHEEVSEMYRTAVREPSQTELGMSMVSRSLATRPLLDRKYLEAANLSWLALNAETNIRQNEKLGGVSTTSMPQDKPATTYVLADEAAYSGILAQINAALSAYGVVDPSQKALVNSCVPKVYEFTKRAKDASKGKYGKVVQLNVNDTKVFTQHQYKKAFEFSPVIADIGTEVVDDVGIKGQKTFKLHLATGNWRETKVTLDNKEYLLGTPSSFVLHLAQTTSTFDWKKMVNNYDR